MTEPTEAEKCEFLARAQGYSTIEGSGWTKWVQPDGLSWKMVPPNPYTSAEDLVGLIEWVRKQEWFEAISIINITTIVGYDLEDGIRRSMSFSGPILQALPDAVFQALKAREE